MKVSSLSRNKPSGDPGARALNSSISGVTSDVTQFWMGRTRNKKNGTAKAADPNVQGPTNQPSIPSLLQKAQSLIIQCNYDLAQRFIRRILEHQPANPEAKEMLGVVLLETGEIAAAKEVKEIVPRSYYCLILCLADILIITSSSSRCPITPSTVGPSLCCPIERRRSTARFATLSKGHRYSLFATQGQGTGKR